MGAGSDSLGLSRNGQLDTVTYGAWHRLARRLMAGERASHTLQPTALVHEAYLRLTGPAEDPEPDRPHLLGAAATAMRRVLLDHARRGRARKRSSEADRIDLEAAERRIAEAAAPGGGGPRSNAPACEAGEWAEELARALERLGELDPLLARLVELRFVHGLGFEQTAHDLGVSVATAKRRWALARGWLQRELRAGGAVRP